STAGVSLFSDPALTQPLPDPASGDTFGNYSLWTTPGPYLVQIVPVTGVTYSFTTMAVGGTVTSVNITVPAQLLTISGCPVTGNGTCAIGLATQGANMVLASPNGSSGTPSFRNLVATDIPSMLNGTTFSGTV